jgi:hypothetical protein
MTDVDFAGVAQPGDGSLAMTDVDIVWRCGPRSGPLATDPDVMDKTGQMLHTRDLGREYGFCDIDGKQPRFYEGCKGWQAA